MNTKPPIRVFHNMARSGGTLVSKCIGAMEKVKLFSEIHPDANHVPYMNVTDQAHRWYGLATQADIARQDEFIDGLSNIYRATTARDSLMVLRDWATIDFLGKILKQEPLHQFRLDAVLEPHYSLVTCSLVRHPLDQWLSTRRLKIYADKLSAEAFFYGYRRYAEAIGNRYVQYEAFTRDPLSTMQRICELLELPYDRNFIDRWHENRFVTGDNKKTSRGTSSEEAVRIRSLPRRVIEPELEQQLAENVDYQMSMRLLGY